MAITHTTTFCTQRIYTIKLGGGIYSYLTLKFQATYLDLLDTAYDKQGWLRLVSETVNVVLAFLGKGKVLKINKRRIMVLHKAYAIRGLQIKSACPIQNLIFDIVV